MTITWLDLDPHPGAQSTLHPQLEVQEGASHCHSHPASHCTTVASRSSKEGLRGSGCPGHCRWGKSSMEL